jgi:hypothetical protein
VRSSEPTLWSDAGDERTDNQPCEFGQALNQSLRHLGIKAA